MMTVLGAVMAVPSACPRALLMSTSHHPSTVTPTSKSWKAGILIYGAVRRIPIVQTIIAR